MRVYNGFDESFVFAHPIVAVGSFDGVHLGHRQLLRFLVETAKAQHTESVVVTFNPHPQTVLRPESDFFAINTLEENLSLIEQDGVDAVVVIPFTKTFAQLSYWEFIEQYLIGKIHASAIVMGPNHALGHNREGNHQLLSDFCRSHEVRVVEFPELLLHQVGVHSSQIRKAIQSGNNALADALLGYHYSKKRSIEE